MSDKTRSNFIIKKKDKLAKYFDNLAKSKPIPNDNRNTIICFLHYQPEASSIPLAGMFADQMIAVIEKINARMKENECLVIKEHPRQFIEYGNIKHNHNHIANVLGYRKYDFYRTAAISLKSVYLCPRNKSVKINIRT